MCGENWFQESCNGLLDWTVSDKCFQAILHFRTPINVSNDVHIVSQFPSFKLISHTRSWRAGQKASSSHLNSKCTRYRWLEPIDSTSINTNKLTHLTCCCWRRNMSLFGFCKCSSASFTAELSILTGMGALVSRWLWKMLSASIFSWKKRKYYHC